MFVRAQVCSRARFARFSGTYVERDFVEAPSQMLENWAWCTESLRMMSGHYQVSTGVYAFQNLGLPHVDRERSVQDVSQPLPDDLLAKLVAAKDANVGLLTKRQLVFGLFDQTIHTQAAVDTMACYAQVQSRVMDMPPTLGTNFAASFGSSVCALPRFLLVWV
jgi:thimet oligopeptidase